MKSLITIVIVIVVAVVGFTLLRGSSDEPEVSESPTASPAATEEAMEDEHMEDDAMMEDEDKMMENGDAMIEEVKVFEVSGVNFAFDVTEIRVKEGDKVRIEFTSTDGFHDWTVDEFNAATDQVNTGGSTSVEFVADQKGTFEFYCSVGFFY